MLRSKYSSLPLTGGLLLSCLLWPHTASANQGLKALGDAIEFLAWALAGITGLSYLLAILYVFTSKTWLKVLSILLIVPCAAVTFVLFFNWPIGGFVGALIILIYGFLIYHGNVLREKRQNGDTAGDEI